LIEIFYFAFLLLLNYQSKEYTIYNMMISKWLFSPLFYAIARSSSSEFLRRKRGIFHPGLTSCEEQKREAREDYGRQKFF